MGEEETKPKEVKAEEAPEPEPSPAPAEEEKKDTAAEEEKEKPPEGEEKPAAEEPPPPPPPFILYVDLHCVGCAKKIERSILKIRGVEGVVMDMKANEVTIKGVVEPEAVCKRIMKKTKRPAKVISPAPAAEGEPLPPVVTSQVSGVTSVELNVNMHCQACADQLKKKILKMRGVQTAETEHTTGKVTVTGTMDAEKLVDYVYRRTKKQARIVPQPEPEPPAEKPAEEGEAKGEEKPAEEEEKKEDGEAKEKEEDESKKEEGSPAEAEDGGGMIPAAAAAPEEEGMKRMVYYYQPMYVIERIPPPQLFSDENPNACCIS